MHDRLICGYALIQVESRCAQNGFELSEIGTAEAVGAMFSVMLRMCAAQDEPEQVRRAVFHEPVLPVERRRALGYERMFRKLKR